ncbi:benzoate 4-monooxygenase cytochrome p450 [Colletotrichum plurivorum]|uniref:Benzoate 4-monooxygenase cytochrome p450 n=1 Tax=Colletotrichum plurivorum TaxID=2175906 RepID=A0A8H6N9S9_9PEZI|nr:benzoate 4-monooxygenase cytochrome p450 [Colletotrichum plurivorum]
MHPQNATLEPGAAWPAVGQLLETAYTDEGNVDWRFATKCILGITLCRFITVWTYNLWFHPLASFPGPIWGRCSLLYRFFHSSRGGLQFAVADAHKKYGDIVRVAPNELSFASVESWKAIYAHPTGGKPISRKGTFYAVFSSGFNSKCIGSESDPRKHSAMRKMLSPAFSQRGLLEQEEIISRIVDKFVNIMGEKAGPGSKGLNMTKWYEMNTFDILGEMAFGESFHSLDAGVPHFWSDIVLDHLYVIDFLDNMRRIGWLSTLTRLLIPAQLVTKNQNSRYARQQVEKRLAITEWRNDFVSLLVDKVRRGEVSKEEMTAHVSSITIAGGETVATALAGLTWFLSLNPDKLEHLTKEIRSSFATYDEINATKAQQLPYLQAVVNEALRLFPPAGSGAPRISSGFEVHGRYIPAGTDVNICPWSVCRDPRYFSDPSDFKPERWLDPGSTDVKEASRPFLLGPRDCIGRNFAWMEMNLVLAKMFWSYDMELVDKDFDFLKESTVHVLWRKPGLYIRWPKAQQHN